MPSTHVWWLGQGQVEATSARVSPCSLPQQDSQLSLRQQVHILAAGWSYYNFTNDTEGIRAPAGRAQWISSPFPWPLGRSVWWQDGRAAAAALPSIEQRRRHQVSAGPQPG